MNGMKKCYLIPPGEQECVWVSAGILSYQLCDRGVDCDNCPLDAAMHRRLSVRAAGTEELQGRSAVAGLPEIPPRVLRYSSNHWWSHKKDESRVRLGIEAELAKTLFGVKGIVFPSLRQHLLQGQTCVWIIMDGGTLPLEAPMDGIVSAINQELIANPHLLSLHPFDKGWLCELETDDEAAEKAAFMTADEAGSKYAGDQTRFRAALASALRGKRPTVGPTLPDGGEMLQNLATMLGPNKYYALVRHCFGWTRK